MAVLGTQTGAVKRMTSFGGWTLTTPQLDAFGRYNGRFLLEMPAGDSGGGGDPGTSKRAETLAIDHTWDGNNALTLGLGGQETVLRFDALDRLIGLERGSTGFTRDYDREGRLTRIQDQGRDRTYTLNYDGTRLSAIACALSPGQGAAQSLG